jgi:hypothetical protein
MANPDQHSPPYKITRRAVPKPLQSTSEDATFIRGDSLMAVADGAGGVGIFAGEWAAYLLENLPETPFLNCDDFILWTSQLWEAFYQRIDAMPLASEVKSKFLEEGSLATLAVAWLRHAEDRTIADVFIYGDSAVILYDPAANVLRALPDDLLTYTSNPYLINWKHDPTPEGFRKTTLEVHPGQDLLIVSDAIAQYLLLSFAVLQTDSDWATQLAGIRQTLPDHRIHALVENMIAADTGDRNFLQSVWLPLLEAMESEAAFKTWTDELYQRGVMVADDYSAVLFQRMY